MGGERPGFANAVYLSERATADTNFCLGYMMKEKGAFEKNCNIVQALELYFMFCSVELTAEQMSVVAASLANAGVCPLTGEVVFQPQTVRNSLSMMASCGMYDFSGEFAFIMGFPAKSGVSGSLMIVIPGLLVQHYFFTSLSLSPFPHNIFHLFLSFFDLGYLRFLSQPRQAWKHCSWNQVL